MLRVEVWRGGLVESRHDVHLAVYDAAGTALHRAGDPGRRVYARSAIKALQALPLVEDGVADDIGLTEAELALCCASHSGEPYHVEAALSILAKAGCGIESLACGAHPPFHAPSARELVVAGEAPQRVHNNCSGKHAGMLALARRHGWPTEGYHELSHPVQQRMLDEVSRWTQVSAAEIGVAIDGCGVVTFALPLNTMARAFATFGAAPPGSAPARLLRAMTAHPEYIAGNDRLCTALMRETRGRVVAKVGAEGVYCAMVPEAGIGIALKVEDGATRAAEVALLAVLEELGQLTVDELKALARWRSPRVENTRGEHVGRIDAVMDLARNLPTGGAARG